MARFFIVAILAAVSAGCHATSYSYPYTWECVDGVRCSKRLPAANETHLDQWSLATCSLRCMPFAGVWPAPRHMQWDREVVPISGFDVTVTVGLLGAKSAESGLDDKTNKMLEETGADFKRRVKQQHQSESNEEESERGLRKSLAVLMLVEKSHVVRMAEGTDESYNLTITEADDGRIKAVLEGVTFFGLRHAIETLNQLIRYDHVSGGLVITRQVKIHDFPAYRYRGVLLDTSRNFVSLPVIKRVIEGMAANKLNTFHWHITDSHSFPFQSRSYPQLTQYGAYSPEKVYTEAQIADLVEFARARGVRVLPELDAPAHVGEGWQWTEGEAGKADTVVCRNKQPWQQYCVEPPCGQINPTNDFAYQVLEGVYSDMERLFDSDLFHMGGDEVNLNCWKSVPAITEWMTNNSLNVTDDGFHQLWDMFQSRALQRLDSVSRREQHKIVIWTSSLTEKGRVDKFLNSSRYIIQIWTTGKDELMAELVNKGFHVIFSNYDALYFDCGFGAWVGEGNNWCSPYIGWQKVYENDPRKMLKALGVNTEDENVYKLVLGQEATLWTEQADDQVIEQRLFPRVSAMAERLWSDPVTTWKDAEHRFLLHRERLVARGVAADSIEPQWCLQNQGDCYL